MRLEDYLSCLLNETKWYSFSRTNFDELTELCRVFSTESEGQAGALGNCRLIAQGVATSCKAFTFKGQTHGLGTPISTFQLPIFPPFFPPIMNTLELFEGKRPCLYFVKSFLVENWKSRYARLCLLKFFKTSVFCLTGNSVHCHHQSPHGEEVQAVLHCCDTTNGSTWILHGKSSDWSVKSSFDRCDLIFAWTTHLVCLIGLDVARCLCAWKAQFEKAKWLKMTLKCSNRPKTSSKEFKVPSFVRKKKTPWSW